MYSPIWCPELTPLFYLGESPPDSILTREVQNNNRAGGSRERKLGKLKKLLTNIQSSISIMA